MIFTITLTQSLKPSSNYNINNNGSVSSHIIQNPLPKFHMNYSSMEPVLFEKLHKIKLSCLVFKVTTLFQFDSTKNTLDTLLTYTQELDANLKTIHSELVNNNNNDHKLYDANQWNLSYSALLTSCADKILDYKLQITELFIEWNDIFTTLDHS